ncbi:MAG: hypothetical protein QOE90_3273 [Thermoplasmata archaeon]|jgi:hypothetical protein|nr:hypothetical protein [Thermoplasmata archaeon]
MVAEARVSAQLHKQSLGQNPRRWRATVMVRSGRHEELAEKASVDNHPNLGQLDEFDAK